MKNSSNSVRLKKFYHLFQKKYPEAKDVQWEKEKGNYEANWGGKSKEDNSVQFTPSAEFIEIVKAIPVSQLPAPITAYVKQHYKGAKITEAGKVTDAKGKTSYEAEVNKKEQNISNSMKLNVYPIQAFIRYSSAWR